MKITLGRKTVDDHENYIPCTLDPVFGKYVSSHWNFLVCLVETKHQIFPELADDPDMFLGESPVHLASRPQAPSHTCWPSKHHVMKSPQGVHLQLFDCGFGLRPTCLAKLKVVVLCCLSLKLQILLWANYLTLCNSDWKVVLALPTIFGGNVFCKTLQWFLGCLLLGSISDCRSSSTRC